MALLLSFEHLQAMQAHAESTYPEECCGLLLGQLAADDVVVMAVRATTNDWDAQIADVPTEAHTLTKTRLTKTRRYWIAPAALLAGMRDARERGWDVVGIYHSHPDYPAVPSECDRRMAWQQYSYLILAVEQGIAKAYKSWKLDEQCQFQAENIFMNAPFMNTPSSDAHFFNAPSETSC